MMEIGVRMTVSTPRGSSVRIAVVVSWKSVST